jgi:hypothetical protein
VSGTNKVRHFVSKKYPHVLFRLQISEETSDTLTVVDDDGFKQVIEAMLENAVNLQSPKYREIPIGATK